MEQLPPHHERIEDLKFRRAVDLLDAGDADGLRAHLAEHLGLACYHVVFEGDGYFANPTLLEFIAENPVRHGTLPANIVEMANVILYAGVPPGALNATLGLVCSGRVARECGVQQPLIELLCEHGATPDSAMLVALVHGEFTAAQALIQLGAREDLPVCAAFGRTEDALGLLADAGPGERHIALALAAQFGHVAIVRALLDAGEDPDRYNPPGAHSGSTPLHQAAHAGHGEVVQLLVERGARLDLLDAHYQGTPTDWAYHGGQPKVEEYLRAQISA